MVRQQTPFRFTEREMDIAKGTDLPDLLTHLGYQVRRVGSYYTTREMDSLRIKERRTWRRYSNQTGGGRHHLSAGILRQGLPGGGQLPAGVQRSPREGFPRPAPAVPSKKGTARLCPAQCSPRPAARFRLPSETGDRPPGHPELHPSWPTV